MNAVQLLNVYVPYFMNPTVEEEKHLKHQPIWSNHIVEGKQVFYAYHWFVRMDGSVERLLTDDQIGWHAGNWDINCRSVAICLDNDYSNQDPSPVVLRAAAKIIKEHYSGVQADRVLGHREVNDKTTCPGGNFLGGWKQQLIGLI
jgi:N-acetyl-anhydromuramyl-L-alanine amidase AmpD